MLTDRADKGLTRFDSEIARLDAQHAQLKANWLAKEVALDESLADKTAEIGRLQVQYKAAQDDTKVRHRDTPQVLQLTIASQRVNDLITDLHDTNERLEEEKGKAEVCPLLNLASNDWLEQVVLGCPYKPL